MRTHAKEGLDAAPSFESLCARCDVREGGEELLALPQLGGTAQRLPRLGFHEQNRTGSTARFEGLACEAHGLCCTTTPSEVADPRARHVIMPCLSCCRLRRCSPKALKSRFCNWAVLLHQRPRPARPRPGAVLVLRQPKRNTPKRCHAASPK